MSEKKTALQLVAKIGAEQRMRYRVTPMPGSLIPADSIGGQLVALSDLMNALGEKDGFKFKTLLSDIAMHKDGSIEFGLVICPAVRVDQS